MKKTALIVATLLAPLPMSATAAPIVIDFEGSSGSAGGGSTAISVDGFYNGGTDSGGTSGSNFGVSFTNANFDSFTYQQGLYNIPSAIAYMPATPLSFSSARQFTSLAFDQFFFGGGNLLTVYAGANGTGAIVYRGSFGQNCTPNCSSVRNNITLNGLGRSVTLEPNANGTGIDNLVLNAVPEPATWAMMLLGFGMVGYGLRARRGKVATRVTYA